MKLDCFRLNFSFRPVGPNYFNESMAFFLLKAKKANRLFGKILENKLIESLQKETYATQPNTNFVKVIKTIQAEVLKNEKNATKKSNDSNLNQSQLVKTLTKETYATRPNTNFVKVIKALEAEVLIHQKYAIDKNGGLKLNQNQLVKTHPKQTHSTQTNTKILQANNTTQGKEWLFGPEKEVCLKLNKNGRLELHDISLLDKSLKNTKDLELKKFSDIFLKSLELANVKCLPLKDLNNQRNYASHHLIPKQEIEALLTSSIEKIKTEKCKTYIS